MRKALYFFVLSAALLYVNDLPAQCPGSDSMFRRITNLAGMPSLNDQQKLKQLLAYNDQIKYCSYRNDSTHAYLLRRIGAMYYQIADYPRSIEYTKKAIEIIAGNAGKPSINFSHLLNCYYNLQMYYDSLNQVIPKMEAIDSCIAIDLRLKNNYYYASILMGDKATYLFNKGDYTLCVKYSELGEKIIRQYYPENINGLLYLVIYKVNALVFLKEYDLAEKILLNELEDVKKSGNHNYNGTIYNLLGIINHYRGAYQESLKYFQKSFDANLKTGYWVGCAEALNKIGIVYSQKLGQHDLALQYGKKALKYADLVDSVSIFNTIANAYVEKGLFDQAFYFFRQAFDKIRPGISEKELLDAALHETLANRISEYVTELIIDKGDAFLKQYKATKKKTSLAEAVAVYKIADQLLARMKSMNLEAESKLFWSGHTRRLYENAIEASYISGNINDVFYFFEKGRALLLTEQLNEQRWLGKKDILQQSQLKKDMLGKEKELTNINISQARQQDLQNQLYNDRLRLESLNRGIRERNPLYYQSFLDSNFITIRDVKQKILNDRKAFISFFEGNQAVYVIIVSQQKTDLFTIDKQAFDSLSRSFINYVTSPVLMNSDFNGFLKTSRQLYQHIFRDHPLPAGRIIISPDGRYFPFEALVTNNDGQLPVYFVQDHAVSYTYSARFLLNEFHSTASLKRTSFMGIAPVKFAGDMDLPELTGSDRSLLKVDNYFSQSTNLVGNKATKNNFLDQFYKHQVIQLYTHASENGNMGSPVIYFSDSTLSLTDLLYENKPVTSLIVLSACQTASGKLYQGEGVFSFNREFAALGIPSSVSNLWQVDNQSTYLLTELFYKHLSKGLPIDVALQNAKKEFIETAASKESTLPYYWAAAILVGHSNPVSAQNTFPWKWLTTAIIILLLAYWGWKKLFKVKTGLNPARDIAGTAA